MRINQEYILLVLSYYLHGCKLDFRDGSAVLVWSSYSELQ